VPAARPSGPSTFYNNEGEAIGLPFTGTITMTYANLVNGNTFSPNSTAPGMVDFATGQGATGAR
jgi:hypothetical protein